MKTLLIKPLVGVLAAAGIFGGTAAMASAHSLPGSKPVAAQTERVSTKQKDIGPNIQSGANVQSGLNVQSGVQTTGGGADGAAGGGR